ncbi:ribosomal protein S18-alanine N-acetyltransferase [Methanocella conradii]|uniref:ribosomal protein S18-alanine N-acetyltransferase n=1 Tax=Methanocella conradii TaxID=1175444 RepID=UPI0024B356CE|nr:ribosomal protein S18-alanine N-acetyltransferase [Methanocella conradii]MDI6897717.1 ribosomal protein S18-alanine N-acetyltransferase [Methanocella conradii]
MSRLVRIRPFELDDSREILEIEEAVFHEPNPLLYAMIESRPMEGFIVAEEGGEVVGYLLGALYMDEARILLLAVKEGYRRRGIGSMLVKEYIDSVRGRASMVRLEVRASNLAAQTFYFKQGFKFLGMVSNYYRNGDNAYIMVKPMENMTLLL